MFLATQCQTIAMKFSKDVLNDITIEKERFEIIVSPVKIILWGEVKSYHVNLVLKPTMPNHKNPKGTNVLYLP
jgi:hypothetical protein